MITLTLTRNSIPHSNESTYLNTVNYQLSCNKRKIQSSNLRLLLYKGKLCLRSEAMDAVGTLLPTLVFWRPLRASGAKSPRIALRQSDSSYIFLLTRQPFSTPSIL